MLKIANRKIMNLLKMIYKLKIKINKTMKNKLIMNKKWILNKIIKKVN